MILILLFAAIISNPTIAGAFFYLGALQLAKDPSFVNTPLWPTFSITSENLQVSMPPMVDRPATVITYQNGTKVAETDYTYDQSAVALVSTPLGHDETNYGSASSAARGNPTTVTRKCFQGSTACTDSITKITYDTTGQAVSVTDANNNQTTLSYADNYTTDNGTVSGNTNTYLTKITRPITNGVAHISTFQYGFNDGKLRLKTDENSLQTTYCYWTGGCTGSRTTFDPFYRLTGTAAADGGQTTNTYNDAGPTPSVATSKTINASKTLTTTAVSDAMGHVTQTQLTSDPQGTVYVDAQYNGLGLVSSVSNPHRTCGSDPTSSCGTTTYLYDALGRKTSTTYPDASVSTTAYCSNWTLVTDPTKRWRRSRTDAFGRLVEVDEPNSPTATVNANGCPGSDPIWVTSYTLDALGNLTNVLQNGSHPRTFNYDSLSRLLTSTNPEVGTITYTYDANGNVKTKKDARAITTTYNYDALNRELSRTYSNGDTTVTTTYDQSACLGSAACQNIGYRTSATDAGGSEVWAYQVDKLNSRSVHADQRTTKATSFNITFTVTSYFDLAGNITQLHYPAASGRVINYTYDAADRPSAAIDNTNGFKYATGWQAGSPTGCAATAVCYTPQGAIYGIAFGPTSTFTGFNITNTYNNRLLPLEFKASSTAGNAIDITYNYVDPVKGGNAGHVFSVTNNLNASRTQSFTYDQVNRITSAGTSATTGSYCWGYQFSYDAWGNLLTQAGWAPTYNTCSQGMLPGVTADGNNHISMFGYDASGDATGDGTFTYAWDGESQLKSANGVTYLYDGDGRRVSKSNGKLYWYGPSGEIIAEIDATGHELNDYIFFGGRHIGTQSHSGVGAFYVEDSLGSSRVLTTTAGVVCYDADFTPYGGEQAYTNTCIQNNYKFEGKERDTETGNDDFGARYYNNRFGRWLSADWSAVPAAVPYASLTNPQSLNLYAMVSDDPLSSIDINGHYELNGSGCGNNSRCQRKWDKAARKFEARRHRNLTSKKPAERAAAASFGNLGEANGIHLGFADLSNQRAYGTVDASGSVGGMALIQVTLDFGRAGNSETITHEGTHVGDDVKFLDSFNPLQGGYNQTLNITHGQTEFNSFKAGAEVTREHGFGPNDDQKIWDFLRASPTYGRILNVLVFDPDRFSAGSPPPTSAAPGVPDDQQ